MIKAAGVCLRLIKKEAVLCIAALAALVTFLI